MSALSHSFTPFADDSIARLLADFAHGNAMAATGCLYEEADWQSACDSALDSNDYSELQFMLDREAAYERFLTAAPRHCERDDLGDFDSWCARFAPSAALPTWRVL